ncbi:MAG: branched-chain amino acid ABC transporter permease [Alphaproteobacteria bacterium]|nr:branched-chain amino acid ABC transporter permease [Alphaproteobacteria bacterium]
MKAGWPLLGAALLLPPFLPISDYTLHIIILVLLWAFVYTSWTIMGRFGLVSLGHGAFLGLGTYVTALLWNHYGLTPWAGIPLGVVVAVAVALVIGYPCSRLKVVGHYFALVTLALTEVVRLSIVAWRDVTGGSLGMTPNAVPPESIVALQFTKFTWYWVALGVWALGLVVWHRVDRSMTRSAMDAIADDETAAAAVGINVTLQKLLVTTVSAALTAFGGALIGQYQMYINPDTMAGVGVSLQIVFAAISGGMYVILGPTVGAILTIVLQEFLRVLFGTRCIGAAATIYGIMLIVFIIFMPAGICGVIVARMRKRRAVAAAAPAAG